jgi:plastocyanin
MMKKFLLLIFAVAVLSVGAFAHAPFTLVSSEKKTIKESDLATIENTRTTGKVAGSNLTFSEREIRIIVVTGPEDDMLSYRVQGIRNPNFVVPSGSTLKILFINVDSDMRHDVRFGHVTTEFPPAPDATETAGTTKLPASPDGEIFQAEEIVIKANENGAYKYFCSVRGHAKGGMWGNIFVGVKPGDDVKTAPKTEHVHSADEDKDDHDHSAPSPSPKPAGPPLPKKPSEQVSLRVSVGLLHSR